MTIRKRDIKLLLILAGIVLIAASYFLVYQSYMGKAQTAEAEAQQMAPRVAQLRGYEQNVSRYRSETSKDKETIAAQMKRYPTDVRPEDMVMYAQTLGRTCGLDISKITFADPVSVLAYKSVDSKGAGTRALTAYERSMTISCNLSYQGLKQMIDTVNGSALRTTVNSISVSFDSETGQLTGNVQLNKYFITGDGDKYAPTAVPDMPLGKSNLFGTVSAGSAAGK